MINSARKKQTGAKAGNANRQFARAKSIPTLKLRVITLDYGRIVAER